MSDRVGSRSLIIVAATAAVLLTPLYLLRFIHPAKADAPPVIAPAAFRAPMPTPAPTPYLQATAQKLGVVLPLPSPSPAASPAASPRAQASPCQPCRENVNDYLAAIAAPFPQNHRNTYEAPQVVNNNAPQFPALDAPRSPIFPNSVSHNYEFGR